MSHIKKWGVAAAVFALIAAAAAATYQYNAGGPGGPVVTDDADPGSAAGQTQGGASGASNDGAGVSAAVAASAMDSQRSTYIVVFKDAPLATYKGTVPGIGAPERYRDERGTLRLDGDGDNAQEYVDYLDTRQTQMETLMSTVAGRDIEPRPLRSVACPKSVWSKPAATCRWIPMSARP
jgi:hypothetical protein